MKKNTRYNFLNIYKFIFAIIIACFLHYVDHFIKPLGLINHFKNQNIAEYLTTKSNALTEFFFIASGILFFIAYVPKIKNKKMNFQEFFINRTKRLLPYVAVTSLIIWILQVICYNTTGDTWGSIGTIKFSEVITNILTFGNGIIEKQSLNGPAWYISVLMFCYVIGYFITKLYIKTNNKLVYFIPLIIGLGMHISVPFEGTVIFINCTVARGLINFFEGILIYIILDKYDNINKKLKTTLKISSLLIVIISIIILNNPNNFMYIGDIGLYHSFIIMPALIYLSYNSKLIEKISNNKFITYIGNLSFDIYMMNFIVLCTAYIIIKNLNITPEQLENKWKMIWSILIAANIIIPIHISMIRNKIKSIKTNKKKNTSE